MGSTTDDRTARAAAWLAAWDRQGVHRTATKGDEAGADWLVAEAVGLGAAPTVELYALDRLDPVDCYLECGGERIPGVPVFDAPATSADGIAGTLGRDIAVVELSPRTVYDPTYEKMRREAPQRGLVIVSTGERPGLGLLNAERFRHPYGPPALQIASEARDMVLAAAARQAPGHLVATSRRTRRRARLLARIAARAARRPAALRCRIHRQQRPRARSSRSRRIHRSPSRLGAAGRGRR